MSVFHCTVVIFQIHYGSGMIFPDPDPSQSFGADRIRIHNTATEVLKLHTKSWSANFVLDIEYDSTDEQSPLQEEAIFTSTMITSTITTPAWGFQIALTTVASNEIENEPSGPLPIIEENRAFIFLLAMGILNVFFLQLFRIFYSLYCMFEFFLSLHLLIAWRNYLAYKGKKMLYAS